MPSKKSMLVPWRVLLTSFDHAYSDVSHVDHGINRSYCPWQLENPFASRIAWHENERPMLTLGQEQKIQVELGDHGTCWKHGTKSCTGLLERDAGYTYVISTLYHLYLCVCDARHSSQIFCVWLFVSRLMILWGFHLQICRAYNSHGMSLPNEAWPDLVEWESFVKHFDCIYRLPWMMMPSWVTNLFRYLKWRYWTL